MQRILRQNRACLPVRSFCLGSKSILDRAGQKLRRNWLSLMWNFQANASWLPPSIQGLMYKRVCPVCQARTHFPRRKQKLFKGVTSTNPRAWCHCCDWCDVLEINLKHKGGGFVLKHPQNRSGKGMSSQSMPNLFSQLAKRLSSNRETTSGLKPLDSDRLDVECGSSNQLQILSKKVISVAALTLECGSCNNPPPSLMKLSLVTYALEAGLVQSPA